MSEGAPGAPENPYTFPPPAHILERGEKNGWKMFKSAPRRPYYVRNITEEASGKE